MKIEKDIPLPPRNDRHFALTERLMAMEVGDSVLVDNEKAVRTILSSKRFYRRKYTGRKQPVGVRFWRTK
jgi:hypothetical protein